MEESARPYVLVCERIWLYRTLTAVAGFFGAFTYLLRGNVFCNAQTGNVVLMGMALGSGQWRHALYYLIPISASIGGAFLSEILPTPVKRHLPMRWETMLIAIEIAAVLFLGLLPESAPVQISQVTINFIASMQYNTFRQAQGDPYASTFCTNNLRLAAENLYRRAKDGDRDAGRRCARYLRFILCFCLGTVLGVLLAAPLGVHSIWACCGLLATALLLLFLMARRGRYSA